MELPLRGVKGCQQDHRTAERRRGVSGTISWKRLLPPTPFPVSPREVQQIAGLAAGVLALRRLGDGLAAGVAGGLAFREAATVGVAWPVSWSSPSVWPIPEALSARWSLTTRRSCAAASCCARSTSAPLVCAKGVPAKLPIEPASGPALIEGLLTSKHRSRSIALALPGEPLLHLAEKAGIAGSLEIVGLELPQAGEGDFPGHRVL